MISRTVVSVLTIIVFTAATVIFFPTIQTDAQNNDCDSSYPDVCIPPPPPQLNCDDITDKNFRVLPPDPHGFDSEGDGIGCEEEE
jgi:micrococcal nuclease